MQRLLYTDEMKLHLFVKRSDAAGKEFYYLGTADIQKDSVKEEKIGLKQKECSWYELSSQSSFKAINLQFAFLVRKLNIV